MGLLAHGGGPGALQLNLPFLLAIPLAPTSSTGKRALTLKSCLAKEGGKKGYAQTGLQLKLKHLSQDRVNANAPEMLRAAAIASEQPFSSVLQFSVARSCKAHLARPTTGIACICSSAGLFHETWRMIFWIQGVLQRGAIIAEAHPSCLAPFGQARSQSVPQLD